MFKKLFFISTTLLLSSCQTFFPKELTLEEKAGSMIVAGFRGSTPHQAQNIANDIRKYNLGGVILFDEDMRIGGIRNVKHSYQLTRLNSFLQNIRDEKLLICIDQEGGKVNRLKSKISKQLNHVARGDFRYSVSAMEAIESPDKFRKNYQNISHNLKSTGINLNLAPIVDVGVNPDNFIYKKERIYSSDPNEVADYAEKAIDIHHNYGILTAIKHFPGHGSSETDSHKGLTDVTLTWEEEELIPFKKLKDKTDMIMTAHIFQRSIDNNYPATLSKKFLTDILRNEIGFNGVIISDDLGMHAISENYELKESVTLAINAGVDLLLFANNTDWNPNIVENVVSVIVQQVRAGKISEARLDESIARINKLKEKIK